MGEYIKNRQHLNDEEIKVAVCRGSIERCEPNYPLKMLKEFSFLGYEDWYAGSFVEIKDNFSFLDTLIRDYDKTNKQFADSREFSEIIISSDDEEDFLVKKMNDGEWDILLLYRGGSPIYVVSNYYLDEMADEFKANGYTFNFKDYQYQHIGKLGLYDFSDLKDNGTQVYYHIDCPNNDSIEVMKNKTEGVWYAVYHNPNGGIEVLGEQVLGEYTSIINREKTVVFQSASHRYIMKLACDWYNDKIIK